MHLRRLRPIAVIVFVLSLLIAWQAFALTELSVRAKKDSTYIVTAAFADEEGDSVTPDTVAWTLYDETDMSTIDTGSPTPAATINIVLSGTDLAIATGTKRYLLLKIDATYDSDLGDDLPLVQYVRIVVEY